MRETLVKAYSMQDDRVDIALVDADNTFKISTYRGTPTSSAPVTKLDGTVVSYIDIICRNKDKVEVLGLGGDKAVWHKVSDTGGSWTNWWSLNGTFIAPPTVASSTASRVDMFGTTSAHGIVHKSKADGNTWTTTWDSLEGHWHSSVGAVRRSDNLIDLVAIDTVFEMYYKLWDSTNSRPWINLGGRFKSPPVIASCGANRVDVFGLDFDNRLLHKTGVGSGSNTLVWTPAGKEWEDLGGDFDSPPTAVSSAADRIDVVAVKIDGSVRFNSSIGGSWTYGKDWLTIGSGATSVPAIVCRGSGKLDVICTFNAATNVCVKTSTADMWNDWITLNATCVARRTYNGFPPYV